MFLNNKYYKWYKTIISRAQSRNLEHDVYFESHHIVPRSLGGSNSKSNIVKLLAREHFICHLLLTKFTSGSYKKKMDHAVFMLTVIGKKQERHVVNNRRYELLRKNYSSAKKGVSTGPCTDKRRQNISNAKKGKPMSEEHKNTLSKIKKGKGWSQARKNAGRKVMTPNGIYNSMSEAERELNLGSNVIAYRIKTNPIDYYFVNGKMQS